MSDETSSPSETGGYEYFDTYKEAQDYCDSFGEYSDENITYFSYVMEAIPSLPHNPNHSNGIIYHKEF